MMENILYQMDSSVYKWTPQIHAWSIPIYKQIIPIFEMDNLKTEFVIYGSPASLSARLVTPSGGISPTNTLRCNTFETTGQKGVRPA